MTRAQIKVDCEIGPQRLSRALSNLTNPQTLNLYAMVADDPETFADLDGHLPTPPQDNGGCDHRGQGAVGFCTEEETVAYEQQSNRAQRQTDATARNYQTEVNIGIAKELLNTAIGNLNAASAFILGECVCWTRQPYTAADS